MRAYSCATWNALMEKESKESIAALYMRSLAEISALKDELVCHEAHIEAAYGAIGAANRSVFLFDHIHLLREKLAATEINVWNDALAEVENRASNALHDAIRALRKD